jgi:hypothetical protein
MDEMMVVMVIVDTRVKNKRMQRGTSSRWEGVEE